MLVIVAAIVFAVTIATGMLTVGFAAFAALNGQNLAELYLDTFPRMRGAGTPAHLSGIAYLIFFAYVIGAAQIAIICRRRFDDRGRAGLSQSTN
jgi:hypothetical protein